MKHLILPLFALSTLWNNDQQSHLLFNNQTVILEICNNEIDDDGDGLIDCFDPDCCGTCPDFYYDACLDSSNNCEAENSSSDISLQLAWSYGNDWNNYSTPISGDIDGDGTIEIIGKRGAVNGVSFNYKDLLIVNGEDGSLQEIISTPYMRHPTDGAMIADVDRDGYAEIFIQASNESTNSNPRHIYCYTSTGGSYFIKWISDSPVGYNTSKEGVNLGIADFNGDNRPEVYALNQLFDSFTGKKIAEGGDNSNTGSLLNTNMKATTIAIDVLPDQACTNCEGLELVCGTEVYAVDIDPINLTGSVTSEISSNPNIDGYTSIADMDQDGDLDGVIATSNGNTAIIFIVDLQTPQYLSNEYTFPSSFTRVSLTAISDIDNNGYPEIIVAGENTLRILSFSNGNLNLEWSFFTNDPSGQTRATTFDFNQDGKQEVIFRDASTLRIFDGMNGDVIFQSFCTSGTGWEVPTIVDIDQDEEAELLCSCNNQLRAYESASFHWPSARPVWNQHAYFNVNINDDLTIPIQQQLQQNVSASSSLNNFLIQYSSPIILPDLSISSADFICDNGQTTLSLEWCNLGEENIDESIPVSVYGNGIGNAQFTISSISNLAVDSCEIVFIDLPSELLEYDSLLLVAADNGSNPLPFDTDDFPLSNILECDYQNNLYLIATPDITIPTFGLGNDTVICSGESLLFSLPGFQQYTWDSTTPIDCYDCAEFTSSFTSNSTIIVSAISTEGCLFTDTMEVTVINQEPMLDTFYLCSNDILELPGGLIIESPGNYELLLESDSCSVTNIIEVIGLDTSLTLETIQLCEGDSIYLFDSWENNEGMFMAVFQSVNGCDSIHVVQLDIISPLYSQEQISICHHDSILLFGTYYSTPGIYSDTLIAENGCDSIHEITLSVYDFPEIELVSNAACDSMPNGSTSINILNGDFPYSVFFDNILQENGGFSSVDQLIGGNYEWLLQDNNNCSHSYTVDIAVITEDSYEVSYSNVSCPNFSDGQIVFDNPLSNIEYIFNGQESPIGEFYNLSSGFYSIETVSSEGCSHLFEIEITAPTSLSLFLPDLLEIPLGCDVELPAQAFYDRPVSFTWQPSTGLDCTDCLNPIVAPLTSTNYSIIMEDSMGCLISADIDLLVFSERNVYIPNAFSPNGDGRNDVFRVYTGKDVSSIKMIKIFDRWGELVFEKKQFAPNDVHNNWDGKFKGKILNPAVFTYIVEIEFIDGLIIPFTGSVNLIR